MSAQFSATCCEIVRQENNRQQKPRNFSAGLRCAARFERRWAGQSSSASTQLTRHDHLIGPRAPLTVRAERRRQSIRCRSTCAAASIARFRRKRAPSSARVDLPRRQASASGRDDRHRAPSAVRYRRPVSLTTKRVRRGAWWTPSPALEWTAGQKSKRERSMRVASAAPG